MNTLILDRPGEIRFTQTAEPGQVPPGHALVRVHRVGICGTDWHAYHGRQPFFSYPRILGHELGVVVEHVNCGDGAQPAVRPGDRCSVEPYLNCGRCIACRRGRANCCASLVVLGVHIDGGMRERIVVPVNKLHRSQTLSLDQLALVEMLAIGAHAVDRAALEPGETILILGAGPIGLSVIPFARSAGVNVIVADIRASRLDFCRRHLDVQHTIDAGSDLRQQLHDLSGGELPTAVFDATGNPHSMAETFELVAPGGRIVFVGLFQGQISFDDPNFHRREITLMATRNALPANFTRIIGMLESGQIDITPWITHRARCEQLIGLLPEWLSPTAGLIKAVVEF